MDWGDLPPEARAFAGAIYRFVLDLVPTREDAHALEAYMRMMGKKMGPQGTHIPNALLTPRNHSSWDDLFGIRAVTLADFLLRRHLGDARSLRDPTMLALLGCYWAQEDDQFIPDSGAPASRRPRPFASAEEAYGWVLLKLLLLRPKGPQ